jgi:hypothetical protein
LPQTAIIQTAERYGTDAVGGLIGDLGIWADGEDAKSYVLGLFGEKPDSNQLRLHIKDIAQRAGVTESMAAAGMADSFARDPWGTNRNDRRFNADDVVQYLKETVGPEGMRAYEGALIQEQTSNARSQASQLKITNLQIQLAKATDPARREQIQNNINKLTEENLNGVTSSQAVTQLENYVRGKAGMAARLREARTTLQNDPESAEAFRAISDMETEIQRDGDLSDREKQLLISTLRG